MRGRIIVSGGGRLRTFHLPHFSPGRETVLEGCGALCAGWGRVYAACDGEGVIYCLDAATLLPCGVFAGGPQMGALCLSGDGERLYALLSGADSVLMLGARDGAPMLLARVGVNPQSMRLDEAGERLVVAGGRDGCAHLLCACTLHPLACVRGDGFCADASVRRGRIRALHYAGEHGRGAAGRVRRFAGVSLMIDSLGERLFACAGAGGWRFVCAGARDAVLVEQTSSGYDEN